MKIEWQAEDIVAGRRIAHPGCSEQSLIGFVAAEHRSDHQAFVLISLSDGMVQPPMTAQAVADQLNRNGDMPIEFVESRFSERGRRGAAARAAALAPERRSEIASAAATARWNPDRQGAA
jgi:hypothetical protein